MNRRKSQNKNQKGETIEKTKSGRSGRKKKEAGSDGQQRYRWIGGRSQSDI